MKSETAPVIVRLVVVCVLLIAMTAVGFAHRVAPVAFDDDLSAYLAAGGTLSELCADNDRTDHAGLQTCDACRLVDAAALPPAPFACAGRIVATFVAVLPAATGDFETADIDPSRPVRAPPVV